MRRTILVTVVVLILVGNASALPWTTELGQLTVPELSFNFVEGFILNGEGFSSAFPSINDFNGIGNFSNPAWYGDMPNSRYVRASGPSETFLLWDIALINTLMNDLPSAVETIWFFYNTPDASYDPEGRIGLLSYFARFDGMHWSMLSSSYGPSFMNMPNEYGDYMTLVRPEGFDVFRQGAGHLSPPEPVPEPGTAILMGAGLVGLVFFRRRQLLNKV